MKTQKQRIKSILEKNRYMVLATADKAGIPWVSPLFYASLGIKRFYWYSAKDTKHSQLISRNSRVAITVFDSRASSDKADAIYIIAHAREVQKKEILTSLYIYAKKTMLKRRDRLAFLSQAQDFIGRSPLRMYVAETEKIWLLGSSKFYNGKYLDEREEVL